MTKTRFTLPALALAAAGLLGACADDGASPAGSGSASGSAAAHATADAGAADIRFAQQMIPHHAQAVEMAAMVPDASSPELRDLAAAIEAAQQPEIDRMTALLEAWGEDVPGASGSGGGHEGHGGSGDAEGMDGMMSADDLEALGATTGPEFERTWLTMMIEHHQGAITMAEAELADGSDPDAQALAQEIVDAQQAEITLMEQLLATIGG
ncbi:MAG TPA: DUF305 domain-containing protein [Jiangellaceae bacterium]